MEAAGQPGTACSSSGGGSSGAQPSQPAALEMPPGTTFLQRRLRRQLAALKEQQTPEGRSFLETAVLADQVAQLLPLAVEGGHAVPALEGSPASHRRRVLKAFAKAVRADYVCAGKMQPMRLAMETHLQAYLPWLAPAAGASSSGRSAGASGRPSCMSAVQAAILGSDASLQLLADILVMFASATSRDRPVSGSAMAGKLLACTQLAERLAGEDLQLAVNVQLMNMTEGGREEEVGWPESHYPGPIIFAAEMQHALCCHVTMQLSDLLVQRGTPGQGATSELSVCGWQQLSAERQEHVVAAAERTAEMLLQLEPDSLKSLVYAACGLSSMARGAEESVAAASHRSLCLLRRACQLALEQRSDFWLARAGVQLVVVASRSVTPAEPEDLQAALEMFERVEPAVSRCKPLLPDLWMHELQTGLCVAATLVPAVQARLQLADSHTGSSGHLSAGEQLQLMRTVVEAEDAATAAAKTVRPELDLRCAGCKRHALGMRRCARCRAISYCSKECRAADWPRHKSECHAP